MYRTILLLLWLFVASRDCAFLPDFQNAGFHIGNSGHSGQVGEGIRDWFRDVKSKGMNKDSPVAQAIFFKPMDLNSGSILKLHKNMGLPMMEKLLIQPGNFMLDLSTLKFDPHRDWGFHIGGWYIIRKAEAAAEDQRSQKNTDDWANWSDFMEAQEAVGNRARGNNAVAKEIHARVPETTTTTNNDDSDESINSDADAANVIDELSVEVLKPMVV